MRRRKHRPAAAVSKLKRGPSSQAAPNVGGGESATTAGNVRRRAQAGLCGGFWLWGRHAVLAAVLNPRRQLERLCALDEHAAAVEAAVQSVAPHIGRPKLELLDRRALTALLPADATHQGFATLARPLPATSLDDLPARAGTAAEPLLVVLDQVTDPRNVGAVLRSAYAFGAAAVVVQDRHAPEEGGALAKAASGALETMPLIRVTNLARTLRGLRDDGFRCVGLAGEAADILDCDMLGGPLALVLGAEGDGLRRLVREACDALVRIPIAPEVDSLNLSAAAAVALYECARARHFAAGAGGG
ncbi:MAG: 23S rRNA (guanosine(2251)-2'-O)-methyltransferase RlmB [Rhodospirillales bacterium]|nr:23S rRNA (guanosine(2251)-2'-O)-methyltransferase RlmB [Rhodospirillales bacterium]